MVNSKSIIKNSIKELENDTKIEEEEIQSPDELLTNTEEKKKLNKTIKRGEFYFYHC